MDYPQSVNEMLGQERVAELQHCLAAMRECASLSQQEVSWVLHLHISLVSRDTKRAHQELASRLQQSTPDWFTVVLVTPDGGRIGLASHEFRPPHTRIEIAVRQFLAFDLHSSLGGWTLSHLWRSADLAEVVDASFAKWHVLPAAACARALLEGVAAFFAEGESLIQEWSAFKERGAPDVQTFQKFRDAFKAKLLQALFGSRLGERATTPTPFKRTNVLTFLDKFAKRFDKTYGQSTNGCVMPSIRRLASGRLTSPLVVSMTPAQRWRSIRREDRIPSAPATRSIQLSLGHVRTLSLWRSELFS